MKDFFLFKRMVTPFIIQILFWLLIAMVVISAIVSLMRRDLVIGLLSLILGPLLVRVACEGIIVFFRINDNLIEIKKQVSQGKV